MKTHNQVRVTLQINGIDKIFWISLLSDLEITQLQNIISKKILVKNVAKIVK